MAGDGEPEQAILDRWFKSIKADKWAKRHTFLEDEYKQHAVAIGRMLLAWNDLHEKLASLFVSVMGGGAITRPLSIWNSVRGDYSRRQILKAAVPEIPDREIGNRDKLKDEILWIIKKVDELEGLRDDAAHTPLYYYPPVSSENALARILATAGGIFTDTLMGNQRAWRLSQSRANLLAEFEYGRSRATILRDYAMALDLTFGIEPLPWPDRPQLPAPPPRPGPRPVAGNRKHKQPPHRRGSSRK